MYSVESVDLAIVEYQIESFDPKFSDRKKSMVDGENGGWLLLNSSVIRRETYTLEFN